MNPLINSLMVRAADAPSSNRPWSWALRCC